MGLCDPALRFVSHGEPSHSPPAAQRSAIAIGGRALSQPDGRASILDDFVRSVLLLVITDRLVRPKLASNCRAREREASLAATWKSNAMTSIGIASIEHNEHDQPTVT